MTDPKHAHDTDNGRYYTHPVTGQQLVSVTNALSVGFAKFGIPPWYAREAAKYALDNLPTIVARSRTTARKTIEDEIAEAAERARDKAAHLGTRIHHLAAAHILGTTEPPDPEAEIYLQQYLAFLQAFTIDIERDVEAVEISVADPARGYAGTLDILVRLPFDGYVEGKVQRIPDDEPRRLWLVDIKTSAKRAATQTYAENWLQLVALKNAKEIWLPDDTVAPMPRVHGIAVLNLRTHTYSLIPFPMRTVDWRAWDGILTAALWKHANWVGDYEFRPLLPSGLFQPKRQTKKTTETTTTTEGKVA